uniref:Orotidine 5'-phosphate decarboxylase n=1 Tax=Steinernema glaseri TaxID=37863 RepID=A0A1I8ACL0_9BILA
MSDSPFKSKGGLGRLFNALRYSGQGLAAALRHEAAFRQELALAVVLTPLAFWLGQTPAEILIAYFAAQGAEDQLQDLCDYIRSRYPHLPIVLDAKRGDVGSTAEQYAREAFERYRADAVTVSPYMGFDSVEPYLEHKDKGVIVLCRTSNPGGSDLQFMEMADGTPLYLHVASLVAEKWNTNGQCALVVGATFPDEIGRVRARIGDMPLLVPGIGAQGGDVVATVAAGMD